MAGNDWMSGLDDRKLISKIAIPGTHDTGAYNPGDWNEWNHPMTFAQFVDIPTQLNLGVRALDLRCGSNWYGSSFSLYHGPFQLPDLVNDAIAAVDTFLNNNPSEFVLLLLKIEPPFSSDWSLALNQIVNNGLGNKILPRTNQETRWPTVGEARGRALILSRFPNPHATHFDTRGWGRDVQDQTFNVTTLNHARRLKVRLQDLFDTPTLQNKTTAVRALMRAASSESMSATQNVLFFNFASYVVNLEQPREVGRDNMNPLLQQMRWKCGVVFVDGADAATVQSIYNDNIFVEQRRMLDAVYSRFRF